MNYDDVLRIRNAQNSMRKRFEDAKLATTEEIAEMVQTETARQIGSPRVTEIEAMIFRMRTELIDYIVAHGLVDGWTMDGALQPVENGKIPITSELLQDVISKMGYLTEDQIKRFLERFLPENYYVSDENYVHTDNNFTDGDVTKLDGVEDGAEVNLVNDVTLDGKSILINKVASLTAESIKKSYESNSNTNAFTDADKAKLAGISDGAEKNRVDDVLVNGRSVLNENKKAVISKEIIKQAYESNPDTNAFTDNEKSKLEGIASGAEVNLVNDVTLDGESILVDKIARLTAAAIKTSYESNQDTNAFTDAEKQAIADNTAKGEANAGAIDQLSQDLSSSVGQIRQEITAIQEELKPEAIKQAYESNPDTNAFTDADKNLLSKLKTDSEQSQLDIFDLQNRVNKLDPFFTSTKPSSYKSVRFDASAIGASGYIEINTAKTGSNMLVIDIVGSISSITAAQMPNPNRLEMERTLTQFTLSSGKPVLPPNGIRIPINLIKNEDGTLKPGFVLWLEWGDSAKTWKLSASRAPKWSLAAPSDWGSGVYGLDEPEAFTYFIPVAK